MSETNNIDVSKRDSLNRDVREVNYSRLFGFTYLVVARRQCCIFAKAVMNIYSHAKSENIVCFYTHPSVHHRCQLKVISYPITVPVGCAVAGTKTPESNTVGDIHDCTVPDWAQVKR